jgi:hypothetical protein
MYIEGFRFQVVRSQPLRIEGFFLFFKNKKQKVWALSINLFCALEVRALWCSKVQALFSFCLTCLASFIVLFSSSCCFLAPLVVLISSSCCLAPFVVLFGFFYYCLTFLIVLFNSFCCCLAPFFYVVRFFLMLFGSSYCVVQFLLLLGVSFCCW